VWERSLHSFEHNRVVSHAQIIIGTPNLDLIGDLPGVSERELLSHPVDVVEVAIGLVLVLLVELIVVESLVIETWSRRRIRLWASVGVRLLDEVLCSLGRRSLKLLALRH